MKKLHFVFIFLATTFICSSHAGSNHKNTNERSYLKPGAPIRLLEPNYVEMEPQSQKTISVEFETPTEGTLIIETKPDDALSVNIDRTQTIDLSQQPALFNLTITSSDIGKHYIMFMATHENNGEQMKRSLGIAIQVGEPSPPAKQKAQSPYVIMDAKETIK